MGQAAPWSLAPRAPRGPYVASAPHGLRYQPALPILHYHRAPHVGVEPPNVLGLAPLPDRMFVGRGRG